MTTQTHALPRIRVRFRKPKPPHPLLVLIVGWLIGSGADVVHGVLTGQPFDEGVGDVCFVIWWFSLVAYRRGMRRIPMRLEWVLFAFYWAWVAFVWL